ncbi:hypothetical protein [Desulfoscipio gibsoniae]|uniref:Lipoprotein n=1 Tax=Desulfoscipio gibsoniae DSM 7213 TaxID=767817 RepID=R4KHP0_9FIRM|nr:hypothetical protein [Desulfoscipio gibsoniae]AGL00010.1 hypothetical protein Desgi_0434 [Desulfoscipio gibsoniae DSM 7213]
MPMGKLNKGKLIIPLVLSVVIGASGCSSDPKTSSIDQTKNSPAQAQDEILSQAIQSKKWPEKLSLTSPSKLAAPFQPISEKLLKTSNFPIFLPTYFPSPNVKDMKWSLNLKTEKNNFTIEIGKDLPPRKGVAYEAGTLSGNVRQPDESPLEKQFESENIGISSINLPNGIKGKEFLADGYPNVIGSNAITWKTDKWSFFVTASPGNGSGSTVDYAHQIVNALGKNDQGLLALPGKLSFIYTGANHPLTEIYWKVNDFTWYCFNWSGDTKEAIQIWRSMAYIGGENVK